MFKKLFVTILATQFASSFCFSEGISRSASDLNQLAYTEIQRANIANVYRYATSARNIAVENNDHIEQARAIANIASAYFYIGDHQKALKLYLESLEIAESKSDLDGIERALNNVSNVYSEIGNLEEALKYRLMLPANRGIERPPRDTITALISLSNIYLELKKNEKAKSSIDQANTLLDRFPDPFLQTLNISSEAKYYIQISEIQMGLRYFEQSQKLAKKNEYKALYLNSLINQCEALLTLNHNTAAKRIADEVLNYAQEVGIRDLVKSAHQLLAKIYKAQNNFKGALNHTEKANEIIKAISESKIKQLAEITKIERQTVETEEKLKQAEADKEITELRLETQTQLQIIWTASILILFSLSFLWYYRKTSRQEIQRQKKVNQELQQLDKVKDRILTNTSHELRTPLNGIVGLSQILLMENEKTLDKESLDHIRLIEKSGVQLSEIVDDILDLAKLRTHFISLKPTEFQLSSLINEVILTCRPLLKSDKVELRFDEIDITLFHDRTRIKQILLNLIGNAAKFTHSGSIRVSAKLISGQVLIKVQDTGIGIPKNMIGRVFEGFEQVDANDNRENGGSGLGLAICKEIVKAVHGRINLSSELGKGTIVEVQIPQQYKT